MGKDNLAAPSETPADVPASKNDPGKGGTHTAAIPDPSELVVRADAQPPKELLDKLLGDNERFRKDWQLVRPGLKAHSLNSFQVSMATNMLEAGWSDQDILDSLVSWRARRVKKPTVTVNTYKRIIGTAKRVKKALEKPARKRPPVLLSKDELENMKNCVLEILSSNAPPTLYSVSKEEDIGVIEEQEGSSVVKVCGPGQLRVELLRRVRFVRQNKSGSSPAVMPPNLPRDVHEMLRRALPPLKGIKRIPTLYNSALVTSSGYHQESGYFFDLPEGLDLTLSLEESLNILDDFFGEFPFKSEADKANAYSVILGAPLKALGNSPGLLVDKPQSQTGASLLCSSLAVVIDGNRASKVAQGKTNSEMEKWLVAKLKAHPAAIIFDNLTSTLRSEMVAAGMTDEHFGGRLLGLNEEILVPTRTLTLMFTGNNFSSSRDLVNRSLRCRLDANHPAPENRTDFRHDLPADIAENRALLVSAVASVVQRWIENGMPEGNAILGSFIRYTKPLSGLMAFAGMPELNGNRTATLAELDPSGAAIADFLKAWWEDHEATPMQAKDLVHFADGLDLAGEDDRGLATSLSGKLRGVTASVFDLGEGVYVKLEQSGRDASGRAKRGISYRLVKVE